MISELNIRLILLFLNPLTTVKFSKTDIFAFEKFKYQTQTPISPELKLTRPWFEDLKRNFLSRTQIFLSEHMSRDTTAGGCAPY